MAWFRREREKAGEHANEVARHSALVGGGKAAATVIRKRLVRQISVEPPANPPAPKNSVY